LFTFTLAQIKPRDVYHLSAFCLPGTVQIIVAQLSYDIDNQRISSDMPQFNEHYRLPLSIFNTTTAATNFSYPFSLVQCAQYQQY
jgi:hypothetical protein